MHYSTNNATASPTSMSTSSLIKDVNECCSANDAFSTFMQSLKISVKMNLHATIVKTFVFLMSDHSSLFDAINSVMKNSHFTFECFEKE